MIGLNFFIALAWKSGLGAGLVLIALHLLRARSAAEKSMIASVGLLALFVLPLATLSLPEISIVMPLPATETLPDFQGVETVAHGEAGLVVGAPARFNWATFVLIGYGVPAGVMLGLLFLALIRLQAVRARAGVLSSSRWQTHLEDACQLLSTRRTPHLLVSDEIRSPISFGLIRPTIIIDRETAADQTMGQAIILHELAHVVRLDWARLLLARVTGALFWFNPLVWLLGRRSHLLCEAAADDAVLGNDVIGVDYAALLLRAVRRANGSVLLPANSMATDRFAISTRVAHALQQSSSRAPAAMTWVSISFLMAIILTGALAAARPVLSDPSRLAIAARAHAPPPSGTAGVDQSSGGSGTRRDRRFVERVRESDRPEPLVQQQQRALHVPVPSTKPSVGEYRTSPGNGDHPGRIASQTADAFDAESERLRQRGAEWSERGRLWAERGERLRQDGIARVEAAERGFKDH